MPTGCFLFLDAICFRTRTHVSIPVSGLLSSDGILPASWTQLGAVKGQSYTLLPRATAMGSCTWHIYISQRYPPLRGHGPAKGLDDIGFWWCILQFSSRLCANFILSSTFFSDDYYRRKEKIEGEGSKVRKEGQLWWPGRGLPKSPPGHALTRCSFVLQNAVGRGSSCSYFTGCPPCRLSIYSAL